MNRILLGGLAALFFVAAGLFWLQGRAEFEPGKAPPLPENPDGAFGDPKALPSAEVDGLRGPAPPEATELTKEQRRFGRFDQNRDGRISRNEMLSTRTAGFRKLDKDGNNLLTFEEWAVTTVERFDRVDANKDGELNAVEFASTRPKITPKPKCKC